MDHIMVCFSQLFSALLSNGCRTLLMSYKLLGSVCLIVAFVSWLRELRALCDVSCSKLSWGALVIWFGSSAVAIWHWWVKSSKTLLPCWYIVAHHHYKSSWQYVESILQICKCSNLQWVGCKDLGFSCWSIIQILIFAKEQARGRHGTLSALQYQDF